MSVNDIVSGTAVLCAMRRSSSAAAIVNTVAPQYTPEYSVLRKSGTSCIVMAVSGSNGVSMRSAYYPPTRSRSHVPARPRCGKGFDSSTLG
jgi:hypothetical protein